MKNVGNYVSPEFLSAFHIHRSLHHNNLLPLRNNLLFESCFPCDLNHLRRSGGQVSLLNLVQALKLGIGHEEVVGRGVVRHSLHVGIVQVPREGRAGVTESRGHVEGELIGGVGGGQVLDLLVKRQHFHLFKTNYNLPDQRCE
jgi:hypothetical protein